MYATPTTIQPINVSKQLSNNNSQPNMIHIIYLVYIHLYSKDNITVRFTYIARHLILPSRQLLSTYKMYSVVAVYYQKRNNFLKPKY